ncbi:HD-GYP domain-containing protein [Brevibacillus fluminis]|uniref:HD-GYP domain-containing protein n=1 Tax=Brevibacillus fluminis TaxID=511487 RepID=UPI003F8ADD52
MRQNISLRLKGIFVTVGFPILALLILLYVMQDWESKENLQILFIYTLLTVIVCFAPIRTYHAVLTLNSAIILSGILLEGTWLGTWSAILENILLAFLFKAHKKMLPNIGQWLVTIWIVGCLKTWLDSYNIPWMIADVLLMFVFFVANTGLCAILISHYVNVSWWTKVKEMVRGGTSVYFLLMIMGDIGARLVAHFGWLAILPVSIAFLTINVVFRQYFNGLIKLEEKVAEVNSLNHSFLTALAHSVDARDPYTHGHSHRVASFGREIAKELHASQRFVDDVYFGGILHDIGKIGIEDYILKKEGKLTDEEYERIKEHPVIGYQILKQSGVFEELLPAIRSHHERIDGKGYPDGLKGEQIPLIARILAVADAFDAMVSDRPYRKGMPVDEALNRIDAGAGTQFDVELARVFVQYIKKLPPDKLEAMIRSEGRMATQNEATLEEVLV